MTISAKQIWIIGASSGIGEALAYELARRGYVLAISARRESELVRIHGRLAGVGHLVVPVDTTDYADLQRARDEIMQRWQKMDGLVYMAGVYKPMRIGQLDIVQTQKIVQVNLLGAFYAVEVTLPELLKQERPLLALCGSVAGYRGLPWSQPYAATKAGLISFAESLRCELGKRVDVRVINPGFVKTRLTDRNKFEMPMIITPEKAALFIADGFTRSGFEIAFPRRFVWMMKLLRLLPAWLYYRVVGFTKTA